ncbi:MAG: DMT family transporter [Parvularculales bacterium]
MKNSKLPGIRPPAAKPVAARPMGAGVLNPDRTMSAGSWTLLIVLSVLWGSSFFFVAVAVEELQPFTIVFFRVFLAALVLVVFIWAGGERLPATRKAWSALVVVGLLNNAVPFSLIAWGQSHIASGLAAVLITMSAIFTAVLAHFFTEDEKLAGHRFGGAVVSLAGVAVIVGGQALESLGVDVLAQGAVLAAALCYAFAAIYARRVYGLGVTPTAMAAGQAVVAAVVLLPLVVWIDAPWQLPVPGVWTIVSVICLGVLSSAVAYFIYFKLLSDVGAANVTLVTVLVPVSALILGILILGEILTVRHLAGIALVGLGLAIVDGRPWRFMASRFSGG